jgi:hypothetical protein
MCWDRSLVLWKRNSPGRNLTKVDKHCTSLSRVSVTSSSVVPHLVFLVMIFTVTQFTQSASSVTSQMIRVRLDRSPIPCWTQYSLRVLRTVTQPVGGSSLLTHNFRIYYNFPAFEGKKCRDKRQSIFTTNYRGNLSLRNEKVPCVKV